MPSPRSRRFMRSGLLALGITGLTLGPLNNRLLDGPGVAPPLGTRLEPATPAATVSVPPMSGTDAKELKGEAGPESERRFFDDWHGAEYGAMLPPEIQARMRAEIDALPPAPGGLQSSDGWSLAGPSGMKAPGHNNLYSGRILDIASRNTGSTLDIWLAAASGGLWHFNGYTGVYTPLTETLATQAVSTVSVDPANPLKIVIGTGEYGVRGGLGIFRSTDGGVTWQTTNADAALTGEVHRIRHVSSTKLVCAASKALLRSGDGGATWSVVIGLRSFDVAVNPAHPDTVYTTIITSTQGQVRRSTDGGVTFPVAGAVGVPLCERGAVALCRSQPWVVYAAFANPDSLGFGLKGMVTTSNAGGSWFGVNLPDNYMSAQGWYDNVVAVDPDDPHHVFVAGVYMRETFNAGATWIDRPSEMNVGLHPDYHAMEWLLASPTAAPVSGGGGVIQGGSAALMIGHDGGWSYETGGVFNSIFNNVPITQYTHVRAAPGSRQVMGGGSQDNGISITTNGGAAWFFRQGGDGSDLSIDPSNTARMWSEVGVYDPPPVFRRHRTEDSGLTWADKNAGITAQGNWYTDVDNDRVSPVYLYTNADKKVYRSLDYGDNWGAIGTFSTTVRAVDVGLYTNVPDAAVWAVLDQSTTGDRVYCWNGATFDQRDAGLPPSVTIRCVIPHPREPNTAFALVNGFASPGHKIFRTIDRGLNWEDVTGNLPNVPLGGIVAHPTDPNQLFVGSEAGSFRGFKSAGRWYWIDWNQGLPKAVIVADMTWADELGTTGKFYVIAGTYGRSMYQREIGDLDVSAVPPQLDDRNRPGLMLAQNVPNPVRPASATRIAFNLPKPAPVKLRVFDVSGRVVATLADQSMPAGPHEYTFTPDGIVPGVYFYRLEAGAEVLSRKMIVRR